MAKIFGALLFGLLGAVLVVVGLDILWNVFHILHVAPGFGISHYVVGVIAGFLLGIYIYSKI